MANDTLAGFGDIFGFDVMKEIFEPDGPEKLFRGRNVELSYKLIDIVEGLRPHWPVTVRQVYYQAVAKLYIPNRHNEYKNVSNILTKLRRGDLLPWRAIEDRTRRTTDKQGVESTRAWFDQQCESFLDTRFFHLCRVIDQPVYIEMATEKDALSSIIESAVRWHCVRLNIVRGQVSATMVNQMAERFEEAAYQGKEPVLIYFGDLDPSGIQIPRALERNMREEHAVDVRVVRAGLNPEQLDEYNLPESMDAAKATDPNIDMWYREFSGVSPTELDAMHPDDLKKLAISSVENELDMDLFDERDDQEREDMEKLDELRDEVIDELYDRGREVFGWTE